MKKFLAPMILSLACTAAIASPVVIDLKAVAHPYDTHPGIHFRATGEFYLNVWNNTGATQNISVVYNFCMDGAGCRHGETVEPVPPHSKWEKEWQLEMDGAEYGIGEYASESSMDVRVDSTGKHYQAADRQITRSHY